MDRLQKNQKKIKYLKKLRLKPVSLEALLNGQSLEKTLPDSVTNFSDTAKIQFIVDKNGIISNVNFQTGVSKPFKESCSELFKDSPHWRPAIQCGLNVKAYRKQTFIVQIDKITGKNQVFVRE